MYPRDSPAGWLVGGHANLAVQQGLATFPGGLACSPASLGFGCFISAPKAVKIREGDLVQLRPESPRSISQGSQVPGYDSNLV